MSRFDTDFAAVAVADLLTQFGETVTITLAGHDPVQVTAIVNRGRPVRDDTEQGLKTYYDAEIKVATSAIDEPSVGDVVTFDSRSHKVENPPQTDAGFYVFGVVAFEDEEFTASGTRRKAKS